MARKLFIFTLLALTLLSPFIGAVDMQWHSLFQTGSLEQAIFFDLRLPPSAACLFRRGHPGAQRLALSDPF